jgi:predicted MPP superfamily phosphohydrolase
MKISVMSDLHLEFAPMDLPGGDVLLLAGDIAVANKLRKDRTDNQALKAQKVASDFFYTECKKYSKVYYIMGNHEYYGGYINDSSSIMRDFLEGTNVNVLENTIVELGDWSLFGATLWTNYNNNDPMSKQVAQRGLNDHVYIKKIYGPPSYHVMNFTPDDAYNSHEKTMKVLELALTHKPTIVMTHHAPTYKSIHEKYGSDPLNDAYASNLSEFILDHPNIRYWFHGHVHSSFDYMVGDCRVIANPRGYARQYTSTHVGKPENEQFDVNFTLEI